MDERARLVAPVLTARAQRVLQVEAPPPIAVRALLAKKGEQCRLIGAAGVQHEWLRVP